MVNDDELLQRALQRYQTQSSEPYELTSQPHPVPEAGGASITYLAAAFARHANAAALAQRVPHAAYRSRSFAQVWQQVVALATAWQKRGMVQPQDKVGIMGFASVDWVIADLACLYRCATSVPLRTGMSDEDLYFIIDQTQLRCIVCGAAYLPQLLRVLPQLPCVQSVVHMDAPPEPADTGPAAASVPTWVSVVSVEKLYKEGALGPAAALTLPNTQGIPADPLISIVYTSGSTGRPKGAMFPESLYRKNLYGGLFDKLPRVPPVTLGFLPLNHIAGRSWLYHTLLQGGLTCFVQKSDMSTFLSDVAAARPTVLMIVPRLAEVIYQKFRREVMARGDLQDAALQQQVMAQMRSQTLGDRLVLLLTGTAPMAPSIQTFLRACFDVPLYDGYGATENGVVTFAHKIVRPTIADYKLIDAPELGYSTQDKPFARGELYIKTDRLIPGYYKNAAATAQLRDAHGYMRTGDIVEERGEDHIVVIDRRSNILKLAQGEFVSITHIESVFVSQSPIIAQIYVHGEATRSYLVAAVVIDAPSVAAQLGMEPPPSQLEKIIMDELQRVGRTAQMQPFEIPRACVLCPTPFSRQNGLLTESDKPARRKLLHHFADAFALVHQSLAATADAALQTLVEQAHGLPVPLRVARAAQACLGLSAVDMTRSWAQLGGDSLSAVQLIETLAQTCAVPPPVAMAVDPNTTLQDLATYIMAQRPTPVGRPPFAQVHDVRAPQVRASEVLQAPYFAPAAVERRKAPRQLQHILLTGANGFLGRFLLLAWLRHAAEQGGHVTCVVRDRSDAAARARLLKVFDGSDQALRAMLAPHLPYLTVRAGDLLQPRLGLSETNFAHLCDQVDVVVHNGALVNHALSYAQLYEPNVLGTAEAMRMAMGGRNKVFVFLSTIGIYAGLDGGDEQTPAAHLWPTRAMHGTEAWGYATSKWAGEVLCGKLRDAGVPTHIFRPSLILPHARFCGELNATDFLTRLIYGLARTRLRPHSFYTAEPKRFPFDGLPVDFVADAIVKLVVARAGGSYAYNMLPNADYGFCLDGLCAALQAQGYGLQPVGPYAHFYARFAAALEALPAPARARAPGAIVSQWAQPLKTSTFAQVNHDAFSAAVAAHLGPNAWPDLGQAYMQHYIMGMQARSMLPELRALR